MRVRYPRHSRVIVRTRRGLEIGDVLRRPTIATTSRRRFADGDLLRGVTMQDELLQARLEKNRQEAYAACSALLAEQSCADRAGRRRTSFRWPGAVLLFPWATCRRNSKRYTGRLAETYEAKVQFRKFTETLIEGCGPGCGTEEAKGQGGCDSCTSCAVAAPAEHVARRVALNCSVGWRRTPTLATPRTQSSRRPHDDRLGRSPPKCRCGESPAPPESS